jgi:tetratricopeptide (TPR) repeat protein
MERSTPPVWMVAAVVVGVLAGAAALWHLLAGPSAGGSYPAASLSDSTEPAPSLLVQSLYCDAYAAAGEGDYGKAADNFARLLAKYPNDPLADDAQYQRGICFFAQGDYEGAEREFRELQKRLPSSYLSEKAEDWIAKARARQGGGTTKVTDAPGSATRPVEEALSDVTGAGERKLEPLIYEETRPAPRVGMCGPDALALLCNRLGEATTPEELARLASTDRTGTSLAGLAKAAKAKGLAAEGLQVNYEYLRKMPKPVLAWVGGNHYVVVTAASRDAVELNDPAKGRFALAVGPFERIWDGYVLAVSLRAQ